MPLTKQKSAVSSRRAPPAKKDKKERTPSAVVEPTRERIREIAFDVFAERGFEGTSTREICARAGAIPAGVDSDVMVLLIHNMLTYTLLNGRGMHRGSGRGLADPALALRFREAIVKLALDLLQLSPAEVMAATPSSLPAR